LPSQFFCFSPSLAAYNMDSNRERGGANIKKFDDKKSQQDAGLHQQGHHQQR